LRVYTTNTTLQSITIDRCTSINDQLFAGGHHPAAEIGLTNNRIWSDQLEVGETDDDNQDAIITGNYVVSNSGNSVYTLRFWRNLTLANNTFVSRSEDGTLLGQLFPHLAPESVAIDDNVYYIENEKANGKYFVSFAENPADPNHHIPTYHTIAEWQALGYDQNSTFIIGLPTVNQVLIEQSEHDSEWAIITIFNWEGLLTVELDLSALGLALAKSYQLVNGMNPAETLNFIYTGLVVSVVMTGWTVAIPIGDTEPLIPSPAPDFMCFVLRENIVA
jgi:hypothetical protein